MGKPAHAHIIVMKHTIKHALDVERQDLVPSIFLRDAVW